MSWYGARVPEAEVMDDGAEVEAYAAAAAEAYLEAIDRSFVEHVARLLGGRTEERGLRVLDVGCGPGQIPIMMARRWPGMRLTGIDAAPTMVEKARADAATAGVSLGVEVLRLGPEGEARLPYADAAFDLVTCNSVLHHLAAPVAAFDEMARVGGPAGAVLIRDLARPPSLVYGLHVRVFGRRYAGEMRRLYEASVRAAYTTAEVGELLAASRLTEGGRARVFRRGLTHLGVERPPAA